MRNGKHFSKKLFRRELSLLLSICMVASLFVGGATFPAFAQGSEPEPGQMALAATTQKDSQQETGEAAVTETRVEIKARLLRQARNGWDPYSATGMSMDEFYALMELFQEGALPLAEEESVVDEIPDAGKPSVEEPSVGLPSFDVPSADEPSFDGATIIGDPGTEEPGTDEPGINDPTPAQPTGTMFIPRDLFLFSGLYPEGTLVEDTDRNGDPVLDGNGNPVMKDITSYPSDDSDSYVLEYDHRDGHDNPDNDDPNYDFDPGYPAGLDPTYSGYTRPPKDWPGIALGEGMEALVTVLGINAGDPTISEKCNVDQNLFLEYKDVYVREVTAQNSEVIVLGAIPQPATDKWVYYYITRDGQINEVSASTLLEGQKFVVRYSSREHTISYQIRYRATEEELNEDGHVTLWGYDLERRAEDSEGFEKYYDNFGEYQDDVDDADIADWVRQLPRLADETQRADLAKAIFGDEFPTATDEGRYAFTATAPAGYTLAFYMATDTNDEGTWINGRAMLVTPEGFTGEPGEYTSVNQGWALGMEPVYAYNTGDHKLMPVESKGPQELLTTGTFYNNNVDADRIVVAVLRKKDTPTFDAYNLLNGVNENGAEIKNDYVNGRGTSAKPTVQAKIKGTNEEVTIPYDYEDLYLWANDGDSEYDYFDNDSSRGGATKPNLQAGNVATIDNWGWNSTNKYNDAVIHPMTPETDENGVTTYSYQWTFQTNDGDNYVLDTLEINRTGITIPFHAKRSVRDGNYGENLGNDNGDLLSWWAETILPDDTVVKVELLMLFANRPQRVYRITVTGAKNNITVTHMNLMQFGSGAPEIAVYELDGVTGDTEKGSNVRKTAIQYYGVSGTAPQWSGNTTRGEVIVEEEGKRSGTHYDEADTEHGGANIRFKLASGYSSPAYLLESREGTVIDEQASIQRDDNSNSENFTKLLRSTQNPVVPYISNGEDPYMKYGDDGLPYPVDKNGGNLYLDDNQLVQFTDWTVLRVYADGTLAPELYDSAGNALDKDDVIAPKGTCVFGEEKPPLKSQYIYSGEDGWYYIRLTGHKNNDAEKFALLTVVAYPTRYVVRYKPSDVPDYPLADVKAHDPEGMPEITHNDDCPTFFQQEQDETNDRPMWQFDDNGGDFYDIVTHSDVALTYTRPYDPQGYYRFVDWVLVDEYDNPVKINVIGDNGEWETDDEGNYVTREFHIASGSFSITENNLVDYAIFNSDLGAVDDDIYVLRLIPTWEAVENPYHYKVALNWVDAQGNLHADYFDDQQGLWQEVLTDYDPTKSTEEGLAVKILTNAEPFQNWIAQHPTYTFWDDVNNVAGTVEEARQAVGAAITDYFNAQEGLTQEDRQEKYDAALEAILNRDRKYEESDENYDKYQEDDDFAPLGNYTYAVYQDNGTIAIWMYEDKGGLVFHKSVDAEPFIPDDEFYFTVSQVQVGMSQLLNDTYKAYPETVYDEMTGQERAVKDSDAWLVRFVNGKIDNIVKNDGSSWPSDPVTYFTVRNGEGIQLYVPGGTYTITELGSKSGGTYRTEVTYVAAEDDLDNDIYKGMEQVPKDGWELPTDDQWLKGDGKTYGGSDQVSATVKFVVGEHDVARVINFSNQTSAVSAENLVIGPYQGETLGYDVTLILPAGAEPLTDRDEKGNIYYYFNFNLYDVTYPEGTEAKYKDEYFLPDWMYPNEFTPPARVKPGSENYQEWWIWHTWRPDGTLSNGASGRLVVTRDTESTSSDDDTWKATTLYTPVYDPYSGVQTGWKDSTYSGAGVIGLKSGQRFYVVCTVPEQGGDINYTVTESDTRGYAPGGGRPRVRDGKAMAAELAYELFKNTKLVGLPRTGGMGGGVLRVAGLTFLGSGLGLAWLNRDLLERKKRASVPAEEKGWGK